MSFYVFVKYSFLLVLAVLAFLVVLDLFLQLIGFEDWLKNLFR